MQHRLPNVRGEYKFSFPLKDLSYFQVGGSCDVFYTPADEEDLCYFLMNKPEDLPITILGNISNTLVLDGGVEGCVINLMNSFNKIKFLEDKVKVGAGTMLPKFIRECVNNCVSSCEQLFCIPGTIGGAVAMNAGIPGFELSDVLISVDCLDMAGQSIQIARKDLDMRYRRGNLPKGLIITSAIFAASHNPQEDLESIIKEIAEKRRRTQPINQATCGSTFKNPTGHKAWELIKRVGCSSLSVGGAFVSDVHCNFLINKGNATANDFVKLIEIIKEKVHKETGVLLQEEIIIIGRK